MNSNPWSDLLWYATPLPMNMTPVSTVGGRREVGFLRFAVRHTPPDQQDPVLTVGGRREVRFLRFAICHTPPDQQNPVSTVAGRTEGRFLRSAVRQASFCLFRPSRLALDEHDAFH